MIVGLDIGSGSLRALGAVHEEGARFPSVVATYKKAIEGVDRGTVVNVTEVANEIIEAVESLEEQSGLRSAHTLISLGAIGLGSSHSNGQTQVSRGDASVTELDIEHAIKDGHGGIPDIRNKSVVHSIPMTYKVDGNDTPGEIIGVRGNKLEVKTLFITYPLQCMNSLKKALDMAHVRVTDIVAGPIAESIPLLSKKQKMAGVALVNIGAQVTSILVYENNTPLLVSTIAVGGDDITRDIALGLKTTLEDAEDIKCGRSTQLYPKRRLEEIIEARLEDICTKITKEFSRIQRAELLPAGIIICGSSSLTPSLEVVFRRELKLPIKIIRDELRKITGDKVRDSGWARSYGLAFLAPHDTEKDVLAEVLTSFFTRVKKSLSQFLP